MAEIVVVGSLNMDLSVAVPRIPEPGETISGGNIVTSAGGKGANQAAACARLGKQVVMVGSVGRDDFGKRMKASLADAGVDVSLVSELDNVASGSAIILVDKNGENCIVISGGANHAWKSISDPEVVSTIQGAQMVLVQLEIELGTVYEVVDLAYAAHVPVIFNPAPAVELKPEVYAKIDYLIPNETEAFLLTEVQVTDDISAQAASDVLLERGVKTVIITLGANGAYVATKDKHFHIPGKKVNAVDTTAAGDAFIGGFACARVQNFSLEESVEFACCAGALTTTRYGAQMSLPTLSDVMRLYDPEGGRHSF